MSKRGISTTKKLKAANVTQLIQSGVQFVVRYDCDPNTGGQPDKPHTFIDDDHVQRVTLARQAKLFAGGWYPDKDYNPNKD